MRRFYTFHTDETETLYVQMPLTGNYTVIEVFEDTQLSDKSFEVVSVKRVGLAKQIDVVNKFNADIRNWLPFVHQFCFNASVLPAHEDKNYVSKQGGFKIKYSTIIQDDGKEQLTPARINKFTKEIEVSKKKFLEFTVPMRICILDHEFSHLFLNKDMYNELEADLNGLILYLGEGFPRYEAHETFLTTFYEAPSDQNFQRYDHIKNFINTFEQLNFDNLTW